MKHPPIVRILRTVATVLVAVAGVVPILLGAFDIHANGPELVALIGVVVLVLTTVAAAIDNAGPAPVLRTLVQVAVALAAIVPAIVAGLAKADVHVDGAALAALAGVVVSAVAALQNLLEGKGTIPTLAASAGATP